jgi:lipopolysaccharide/colanic/teichoic acid biosynthesis glycosyltransferase
MRGDIGGVQDITKDSTINKGWAYHPGPFKKSIYLSTKRAFDIIVCTMALPVLLGLMCVIFIGNRFWNKGPLFFTQERMGKDHEGFRLIKFRSMIPDDSGAERGPYDCLEVWRITPFGRWMRNSRIDEVPQILNVLFGDMSLIGPRPECIEFARTYAREVPGYGLRGTVRPGITGYSQVKQGYTDSAEMVIRKTELDTFYIRNMDWWLDLKVLFWTIGVLISFHGAR